MVNGGSGRGECLSIHQLPFTIYRCSRFTIYHLLFATMLSCPLNLMLLKFRGTSVVNPSRDSRYEARGLVERSLGTTRARPRVVLFGEPSNLMLTLLK